MKEIYKCLVGNKLFYILLNLPNVKKDEINIEYTENYKYNIKVQQNTIDTLPMQIIFSVVNYMAKWN